MRLDWDDEKLHKLTGIDPWFLFQFRDLINEELNLEGLRIDQIEKEKLLALKQKGFSDRKLATCLRSEEKEIRKRRISENILPAFKRVDTCAGEFATETAYMYSTYDGFCESNPTENEKVIVLGSGPNRIGQGIEFDYCCVHASMALQEEGYESIMILSLIHI